MSRSMGSKGGRKAKAQAMAKTLKAKWWASSSLATRGTCWRMRRMDAEAIASKSVRSTTCRDENAQAVFARPWPSKALMRGMAEAAIADISGVSKNPRLAIAHAVFEMFCFVQSRIRGMACDEIAAISGS